MYPAFRRLSPLLLAALVAGACADAGTGGGPGPGQRLDSGRLVDSGILDLFTRVDAPPRVTPLIQGRVTAPEGTIPISGALVYATQKAPPPIPQKVFCHACVELTTGTPNTRSKADGSFKLKLPYPGKWVLVTQKGAFRRVRNITVPRGGLVVPAETTRLPAKTDLPKGDTIPKMAVIKGAWDGIEHSLARLGLGKVNTYGRLVAGSESFALATCKLVSIFPPKTTCKPEKPADLLQDYATLSKYQILFVPCDSDWLDGYFADPKTKANLLRWIKAGGRLYVTDYQYDLLTEILPKYIHWENQDSSYGSAERTNPYDAWATVNDKDMKAWLAAQGVTTFKLLEAYTVMDRLSTVPTPGPKGKKTYSVKPKVWISGDVPSSGRRPMTVSYPYGCGRVMFSSYHTEGKKSPGPKLLPQEKALIYVLLEVSVCIKPPTLG